MEICQLDFEHFDEDKIYQVFLKSCEWFNVSPHTINVAPSCFEEWLFRLQNLGGQITYTTFQLNIVGFVFTYIRNNVVNSLQRHIWLAATDPLHRRAGIMKALFKTTESAFVGLMLTVNTYPSKFPNMPKFLESQGYVCFDIHICEKENAQKHCYSKLCV